MKRLLTLMFIVLFVGGMPFLTAPATFASQQNAATAAAADDEAQVRAAIGDLTRFAQDGDMSALYDRMAPAARNLISREIWLAWTTLAPRLVPTGSAAIDNVTIGAWTWPVTGEAFDHVATVHLTQAGTLAGKKVTQEQVLHLIKVDDRWRLLPLFSPWIAIGAVTAEGATSTYASPFETPIYAAIDTFWAQNFEAAGQSYEPPRDIVDVTRNAQVSSGCGTKSEIEQYGIYYCTVDETIYFSPDFRTQVLDGAGDYGWNDIIAHEWGHHIQDLLNLDYSSRPELDNGFYTIELELQADCLAGMFMQDQFATETIGQPELDQAILITGAAGDSPDTTWDDPSAHGTGAQRKASWQNGFDNGFSGCRLDLAAA